MPDLLATYDAKTHRYTVRCWVDAQNSFGAKLRTRYTAVLLQTDPDAKTWTLRDLKME